MFKRQPDPIADGVKGERERDLLYFSGSEALYLTDERAPGEKIITSSDLSLTSWRQRKPTEASILRSSSKDSC